MAIDSLIDRIDSAEFFRILTAEAWMDPDLAKALHSDKADAIARFAREQELPQPCPNEIEQFELAENPVGVPDAFAPKMATNTIGCSSSCSPTYNPGCVPPTMGCSAGCPTNGCSASCPTVACVTSDISCTSFCAP